MSRPWPDRAGPVVRAARHRGSALRAIAVALLCLLVGVSVAASLDSRGWHPGTPASNAAKVLGPLSEEPIRLALPPVARKKVEGPTLLVYFSPGCPHCQRVAPEVGALARRMQGRLTVLGVANGGSKPSEIKAFEKAYGWDFEVLHDVDRTVAAAMGAQSTPSAVLVEPDGLQVVARDLWYPYAPGSDVLVEMRLAKDPWSVFTPGRYTGNHACGACHVDEAEAWLLTHHSVAWPTLIKAGKQADAECVGCHVTGYEQPGGWDGSPTSHLVDVGCEACHGPSGPHDGARTEPASTCQGCHDAKHSIAFSVAKGLPLIDHYAATVLTTDQMRAERRALFDGTAPRDLLAFEATATVGAETCQGCHASEHASWTASPHGRAMASLAKAEAGETPEHAGATEDVACVRCHATARQGGPPPETLAGYRTDESVGCEACHGPGEAHVASRSKDDIVGLGESCPVCVIEAVCTRCHTADRDPDWNLEADLPKVGHRSKPAKGAAR